MTSVVVHISCATVKVLRVDVKAPSASVVRLSDSCASLYGMV